MISAGITAILRVSIGAWVEVSGNALKNLSSASSECSNGDQTSSFATVIYMVSCIISDTKIKSPSINRFYRRDLTRVEHRVNEERFERHLHLQSKANRAKREWHLEDSFYFL